MAILGYDNPSLSMFHGEPMGAAAAVPLVFAAKSISGLLGAHCALRKRRRTTQLALPRRLERRRSLQPFRARLTADEAAQCLSLFASRGAISDK
jgi:hypothetical protein